MSAIGIPQQPQGRQRAALFRRALVAGAVLLGLAGCSSTAGQSPLMASFEALFPADDVSQTAESLPYASLAMTVAGNGGLWIMASQTGATTYWQSRDASVALRHGYLARSAGMPVDLLATRIEAPGAGALPWQPGLATQRSYAVTRTWRDTQGSLTQLSAEASLDCAPPQPVALPLRTLALQRCAETLHWQDGSTTHGTLWRRPDDGRLWAMTTRPWPDAPELAWEVARPWWQ